MLNVLILIGFSFFCVRRTLSYLHIFQQEEYNPKRFINWLFENHAYDKKLTAVLLLTFLIFQFTPVSYIAAFVFFIAFCAVGYLEKNPLRDAKKALIFTKRAQRIFAVSLTLTAVLTILCLTLASSLLPWIVLVQLIPFFIAAAALLLSPYENSVNSKFRQEAVDKLSDLNPYVIAITGSYGKTSVKHILGHILHNFAPTLITPGSVNTEMGITRIIREQLQSQHKYFIVEMGAYGIGSIARLCRLTPPKLSVVTAIGHAHYERFKTLEDTAKAKFEIAEAAIKNEGHVIIQNSVLERKYVQSFLKEQGQFFTICGDGEAFTPENVKQSKDGLEFDFSYEGKSYSVQTPIYGLHHVDNILLSIAISLHLGMKIEDIILTLKSVPQIKHRLEVKPQGSYTLIDDAFNSNPKGFKAALELLGALKEKDARSILITPGMVEMGDDHDSEHEKLGKIAADYADIALIVQPNRIKSFVEAYKDNNGKELIQMDTFHSAQEWLNKNVKENDVVLIENDLPDLYEQKLKI